MNCEMQQKPPLLREGFRARGAIDEKMGVENPSSNTRGGEERKEKNTSRRRGDQTVKVHAVCVYISESRRAKQEFTVRRSDGSG